MNIDRLRHNLDDVQRRIRAAAGRAGRPESSVRLLPVTKTVDCETIEMLAGLGFSSVGENRVQAGERKRGELPETIRLEMIGHLQRNKVRKALPVFDRLHAVDSIRLAEAVDTQVEKLGLAPMPVLFEVNVSGEEAKWGFTPEALREAFNRLAHLEHLRIEGLMTMAPFVDDPEQVRGVFRGLRELRDELAGRGFAGVTLRELSMGMSQDFEIAVEEGATMVRVGSAIFS